MRAIRALMVVGGFLAGASSAAAAEDWAARPFGNAMGDGLGGPDGLAAPARGPLPAVTCADGETVYGIDVSYYQGTIDWDAVVAGGVEYAFIRVSHSLQFFDPEFDTNWAGARAAGLHTGVYQYFEPDEDPIAQAQLLLDNMGPLAAGDLPPVIDVESAAGQSPAAIVTAVQAWIDHVEGELGVAPIIYTGKYFWQDNVGSDAFADYPLWAAHYTEACPNIADQWADWTFHQYCDCGTVAGISGAVDVNDFNGSLAELGAFVGGECGDGTCSGGETPYTCLDDCPPCGIITADGDTVDNGSECVELHGPPQFWREEAAGQGGTLHWTHATDFADPSNFAVWRLFFAQAGSYQLEVHVPAPWGGSTQAAYVVAHASGENVIDVDQSAQDGWVDLGAFDFDAEADHFVRLNDNTGEPGDSESQLVVDALRVTALDLGGGEESTSGEPPATSGDPSGTSGPPMTGPSGEAEGGAGGGTSMADADGGAALPGPGDDAAGCGCHGGRGGPGSAWALALFGLVLASRRGAPRRSR